VNETATIGLAVPAITGCLSAIYFAFWRNNRADRAALAFGLAFASCAAGFTANNFFIPRDTMLSAASVNAIYAVGIYFLVHGVCIAFKRRTPRQALVLAGGVSVCTSLALQHFSGDIALRVIAVNLFTAIQFGIGAIAIWGSWKQGWTGTAIFSAFILVTVYGCSIPILSMSNQWLTLDGYFSSAYWLAVNLVMLFSVLAVGGATLAYCIEQQLRLAREDADRDFLTGLKTRRAFEEQAAAVCARRTGEKACSLILMDIDHFKRINDSHGHVVGDAVLRAVGQLINTHVRRYDVAGRVGGEEFCILLPGSGTAGARQLAARLKSLLPGLNVDGFPGEARIMASFGIAEFGRTSPFSEVYACADAALYAAKDRGRNRIVCNEPPQDAGVPIRREHFASVPMTDPIVRNIPAIGQSA